MTELPDHRRLYRLPGSLPDDAISWLAWSCRLEEPINLGGFVQTVPRHDAQSH